MRHAAAVRAEAVALAAAVGPKKAAAQMGVPRRTVSYWLHQPANTAALALAEQHIADELRRAHALALAEVMAGLRNPKARLGDKATALRVLGDQLALAEGRATANIATSNTQPDPFSVLTDEERAALTDLLDEALEAEGVG